MKSFILIVSLTFSSWIFGTEIEVNSRINISQFHKRAVKHSYCLFSKANSHVDPGNISASGHGKKDKFTQTFSYRGKTYLRRKVSWDSESSDRSMLLSFASEDSNFSAHQKFDKSHCSYRYWKSHSTSAETKLSAKAAFKVPANVWIVRIRSKTDLIKAKLDINLYNEEYTENKIAKKLFHNFNGKIGEKYFLINATSSQHDTYVHFDLKYLSRSFKAEKFILEFEVDFIAATECLDDLSSLSIKDLISTNYTERVLDNGVIVLACMMNPHYVKHTLNSMHLYNLDEFFKELSILNEKITSHVSDVIDTTRNDVSLDKLPSKSTVLFHSEIQFT